MSKPTKPQLELIERALKVEHRIADDPIGLLPSYCVSSVTLGITEANGWIILDHYIREEGHRKVLTDSFKTHLLASLSSLDALDIKGATKATDNARWCGNRLLATGYWVTDAGRALVNKERGGAA